MSRKTQRYSKEFKAEAVRTVLENQLSISEGASRLSLPEGTLGQWVTAARKGLGTPGSRTVAELESEILQLRKALNEARLERDILNCTGVAEKYALIEQWRQQFPIEAMCQVFGVPECIRTPERLAFRLYTQPKRLSLNTTFFWLMSHSSRSTAISRGVRVSRKAIQNR